MADNVARWIAGASALGTALNMSLAFMTYRRVRPRLTVKVEATHRDSSGVSAEYRSPDFDGVHFGVRLVNRSATAVEVERLALNIIHRPRRFRRTEPVFSISKSMEGTTLGPMGGARTTVHLKDEYYEPLELESLRAYVTVELSSGREVRSKQVSGKDVHRTYLVGECEWEAEESSQSGELA